MKVTPAIQEAVAMLIEDGETDAEMILTNLVEFGTVDEEYEISDELGIYDEAYDQKVQAAILHYIERTLLRKGLQESVK